MKKSIIYIIIILSAIVAVSAQSDTFKLKKAVQCTALTQKGVRCKNMTLNKSGKCWWHYHSAVPKKKKKPKKKP